MRHPSTLENGRDLFERTGLLVTIALRVNGWRTHVFLFFSFFFFFRSTGMTYRNLDNGPIHLFLECNFDRTFTCTQHYGAVGDAGGIF